LNTVRITVKLFGVLKTLAGHQQELSLELTEGSHVRDLVDLLHARYPQVGEMIVNKQVLISINQEMAHQETEIHVNDEIALLPPFAGGKGKV